MTYADRSDTQLVALSHRGVAPAFAVLVHRHGPTILGLAARDEDPIGATVATFVRAMRTLPDASEDVAGWLLDLTALELDLDPASLSASDTGASVRHGAVTAPETEPTAAAGESVTATLDPRLDEVWTELDRRWPDGKLHRHVPSWALWLGTTVVLLALAVLLPWAALGSIDPNESVDELRASPLPDAGEPDEEPEEDEEDSEELEEEPLPSFDFPEPPDRQANSASSGSPVSGESAEPTRAAAPPTPEPTDEPDPDTVPTNEQSGDDAEAPPTTDDDVSDGGAGDEPPPGDAQDPDADAGNTDTPATDGDSTTGGDSGRATPDDDGSATGNGGPTGDPGTVEDVATDDAGPAETDASTSVQPDTTRAVDPDATSPDSAEPGTRTV